MIEKYSVKYISISYMKWISSLEIDAYVTCVIQKEKEIQHFSTHPEAGALYTEKNKKTTQVIAIHAIMKGLPLKCSAKEQ